MKTSPIFLFFLFIACQLIVTAPLCYAAAAVSACEIAIQTQEAIMAEETIALRPINPAMIFSPMEKDRFFALQEEKDYEGIERFLTESNINKSFRLDPCYIRPLCVALLENDEIILNICLAKGAKCDIGLRPNQQKNRAYLGSPLAIASRNNTIAPGLLHLLLQQGAHKHFLGINRKGRGENLIKAVTSCNNPEKIALLAPYLHELYPSSHALTLHVLASCANSDYNPANVRALLSHGYLNVQEIQKFVKDARHHTSSQKNFYVLLNITWNDTN